MSSKSTTRTARIRSGSSERRQRQKLELRHSILQAAGELFLEHGYENFSLRQVAERIGYSATTIYLYFQNKDDLLLAVVQDGFESFDRGVQAAAAATTDPLRRIEALGRAYISFWLENPALYRLMFMQRSDFYFLPRLNKLHEEAAAAAGKGNPYLNGEDTAASVDLASATPQRVVAQELLVEAVRDGIAQGVLRPGDPFIIADVLWAGAHGLVSLANSPLLSPPHARAVIDQLLATLIEGIKRHRD
jgi:AcrR family transcriptional regulator